MTTKIDSFEVLKRIEFYKKIRKENKSLKSKRKRSKNEIVRRY